VLEEGENHILSAIIKCGGGGKKLFTAKLNKLNLNDK
jgi:hypothetical protein